MARSIVGEVAGFDAARGWGTIRHGSAPEVPFHCTAIADGTRDIPQGVEVVARVVAGHSGRWEAADIVRRDRA